MQKFYILYLPNIKKLKWIILINDLDNNKNNKLGDNLDIKFDDSESDNESLNNNKDLDITWDNDSIEDSFI